ncbi:MAG TPA: outer membrane lipoprotein-sorting protein [Myxococcota bacterium]|nr:outer membrane lipoprotein-sorting protein [Myxococcota bacterium]HRY94917.1 outer membrane lipoprotein-sorting protein [Myxococcota bacterium]HSA21481.1 outer membrane lipoprotein-sorting protein [Myxococcota bacterium]
MTATLQALTRVLDLIVLGLLLGSPAARAADLTAREIMVKSYEVSRVQDSTGVGVLTLYNASGDKRVRETTQVGKLDPNGRDQKRLIRFVSPADVKGTGLLTVEHHDGDDDIWIYLPALRKVRRIVSQEKSNTFMGSEFSYVDILDPQVDDYTHTLVGKVALEGVECFKIESVPTSAAIKDEHGYAKKVSWIRGDNFVASQIDFYDKTGALLKTQTARNIHEVDKTAHKWLPLVRVMSNHQTKRRSELVLKDIKVNVGVGDDVFSTANLERGR